ncbi:ProQ/FINO family protein [Thiohalorhabdus methylotrophus]|uniref:ProQ/FINO family protein n=1 Tax=Thiohalorhabdus methylotrophus TaxID=3242694 RepID=A0ABV4TQH8_9GAMM
MNRHTSSQQHSSGRADALLEEFRRRFPVFAEFRPLAPGIENELQSHFPDDPNWRIIAALRRHVNDSRYLKATFGQRRRYNLIGQAVGEVTTAERAFIRAKLHKRAEAGESAAEEADPLEDLKNGQRLLLSGQVDYLYGEEVATACQPYLERIGEEKVLEELGVELLRTRDADDWLQTVRDRVPDVD